MDEKVLHRTGIGTSGLNSPRSTPRLKSRSTRSSTSTKRLFIDGKSDLIPVESAWHMRWAFAKSGFSPCIRISSAVILSREALTVESASSSGLMMFSSMEFTCSTSARTRPSLLRKL